MNNQFERSERLLGKDSTKILSKKKVLIFGIGGVGGYALEGLVRSGIGEFLLVDYDKVAITNLNRQIIALHSTLGEYKTIVAKKRAEDINPKVKIETLEKKFLNDNLDIDFSKYDYVIDCIDLVAAKINIAKICYEKNIPVISAMGAGNKFNPTKFQIADITKTSVCPLAKVMRQKLKKENIPHLKVIFSTEQPQKQKTENGKNITASLPFVPSVAGLIIASEVVKDLLQPKSDFKK